MDSSSWAKRSSAESKDLHLASWIAAENFFEPHQKLTTLA